MGFTLPSCLSIPRSQNFKHCISADMVSCTVITVVLRTDAEVIASGPEERE